MSDKKIKWLFFDLGSTLVDETECVKKRCDVIIENSNIDKDEFYAKVKECAKTDSYAVKAAAQYYGAEIPRWFGELEKLYPDTVTVLDKLSRKYKLGIIANQVAGTQKRIDNWGIGKYFDMIVASAEVG
ncbi:MAG: HAD family hydrolase, partial [Clostridia bacterium]|nr:HAD family hydrolase [Clostridia bacterium]